MNLDHDLDADELNDSMLDALVKVTRERDEARQTIATYRAMDKRVADGWYYDADADEDENGERGVWVRHRLNGSTEYELVTDDERAILEGAE